MRADDVVIEAPCAEDWDRMRPEAGGRRRWCERCERQVHDLSAMSEPAALAFLRETAGRDLCIAYFEDQDGEIVFAPGAIIVPIERVRRRPSALRDAAKLASAASLVAVLGACTPHGDDEDDQTIRVDEPSTSTATMAPTVVIPSEAASAPNPTSAVVEPPQADAPCDPPPVVPTPKIRKKGKRTRGAMRRLPDESALGGL